MRQSGWTRFGILATLRCPVVARSAVAERCLTAKYPRRRHKVWLLVGVCAWLSWQHGVARGHGVWELSFRHAACVIPLSVQTDLGRSRWWSWWT